MRPLDAIPPIKHLYQLAVFDLQQQRPTATIDPDQLEMTASAVPGPVGLIDEHAETAADTSVNPWQLSTVPGVVLIMIPDAD